MFNISSFFSKFVNLEKDNNTKISVILDMIKNITGIELAKEMFEIKESQIRLNCNPVFKNEIFMHKSEIENSLKSQNIYLSIF